MFVQSKQKVKNVFGDIYRIERKNFKRLEFYFAKC